MVDGERSDFVAFLSGVPQGSVIGPVPFLDPLIPLELYLTITSEDHCRQLQDDLDALQKWEATWRMAFSDTIKV